MGKLNSWKVFAVLENQTCPHFCIVHLLTWKERRFTLYCIYFFLNLVIENKDNAPSYELVYQRREVCLQCFFWNFSYNFVWNCMKYVTYIKSKGIIRYAYLWNKSNRICLKFWKAPNPIKLSKYKQIRQCVWNQK